MHIFPTLCIYIYIYFSFIIYNYSHGQEKGLNYRYDYDIYCKRGGGRRAALTANGQDLFLSIPYHTVDQLYMAVFF